MGIFDALNTTNAAQDAYNAVIASSLGISMGTFTTLLAIITVWSIVWKGLALWKSAMKKHVLWFILLLIVNTAGILEILYIFVFSKWVGKIGGKEKKPKSKKRKL